MERLDRAGREVLDHDVGHLDQCEEVAVALVGFEIQGHRRLAAIDELEAHRIAGTRRSVSAQRLATTGRLDLDDVRA